MNLLAHEEVIYNIYNIRCTTDVVCAFFTQQFCSLLNKALKRVAALQSRRLDT